MFKAISAPRIAERPRSCIFALMFENLSLPLDVIRILFFPSPTQVASLSFTQLSASCREKYNGACFASEMTITFRTRIPLY